MKIESVKIKRAQIIFSKEELKDMRNACKHLETALSLASDMYLNDAVSAMEDVLNHIDIEGGGEYFLLDEEILRDDA